MSKTTALKALLNIGIEMMQKIADYYADSGQMANYFKVKGILDTLDELYYS